MTTFSRDALSRAERKKLLLAEGALHRLALIDAGTEISRRLAGWTSLGTAGGLGAAWSAGLRSALGRNGLAVLATTLPLLLGTGRMARLLRRLMLMSSGVAAVWSAIRRWRDTEADGQDKKNPG